MHFRISLIDSFTVLLDISLSYTFDVLDFFDESVTHVTDKLAFFFKTLVEYVVLLSIFFDLF